MLLKGCHRCCCISVRRGERTGGGGVRRPLPSYVPAMDHDDWELGPDDSISNVGAVTPRNFTHAAHSPGLKASDLASLPKLETRISLMDSPEIRAGGAPASGGAGPPQLDLRAGGGPAPPAAHDPYSAFFHRPDGAGAGSSHQDGAAPVSEVGSAEAEMNALLAQYDTVPTPGTPGAETGQKPLPSWLTSETNKLIKTFFEKADKDFNGSVDFNELLAVVKLLQSSKGGIPASVQGPGGSGRPSGLIKKSLSKAEWMAFFSKHDANGDNALQFHEFQQLLIDVYQTHALAFPGFNPR